MMSPSRLRRKRATKKVEGQKIASAIKALRPLFRELDKSGFKDTRSDLPWWGRLVENAAGAHLLNSLDGLTHQAMYWRDGNDEVDFVIKTPRKTWAVEVKSGLDKPGRGLSAFLKQHPKAQPFIIGPSGMPLEEFFAKEPAEIFD